MNKVKMKFFRIVFRSSNGSQNSFKLINSNIRRHCEDIFTFGLNGVKFLNIFIKKDCDYKLFYMEVCEQRENKNEVI